MNFLSYKFKALKQAISKYDYLYFTVSDINYYGSEARIILADSITGVAAATIVIEIGASVEAANALQMLVDEKALIVYDCKVHTAIMAFIRTRDTNVDRYRPVIVEVFDIAGISAVLKTKHVSSISASVDIIVETGAKSVCFDQADINLITAQALAIIVGNANGDDGDAVFKNIEPVSIEIETKDGDVADVNVNVLEVTSLAVNSENIVADSATFALFRVLTLEDHYNKNLQWLAARTLKEMSLIQIQ